MSVTQFKSEVDDDMVIVEEALPQEVVVDGQDVLQEIVPAVEHYVQVGATEDAEAVQFIVIQQQEEEQQEDIKVFHDGINEMVSVVPDIAAQLQQPQQLVTHVLSDTEEMLKSYYATHSNSLGDTWYTCNTCPTFQTSHNSSMRDHINCLHVKMVLRCTHCEFETYRFKTLNCHRKQAHGVGALACWVDRCNFKTIIVDRLLFHVIKKHDVAEEYARRMVNNQIANQPTRQKPREVVKKLAGKKSSAGRGGGSDGAGGRGGAGKGVGVVEVESGSKAAKSAPVTSRRLPHGQRKTDEERQYKSIFGDDGKQAYVQCLYCDFTTKLSSNMPGHVNAKHLGRQLKCEECSFSTFYPKNLAVHLKKLHHRETRRCAVPGCKFRSIEDSRMNQHLVEKHGGMYDTAQNAIFVDI